MPHVTYDAHAMALSDYMIATMQMHLRQSFDFWVDWRQVNAFNGTLLANRDIKLQLMFFSGSSANLNRNEASGLVWTSDALAVQGFVESDARLPISRKDFDHIMTGAVSAFPGHASSTFREVSRIHVWAHFDNTQAAPQELATTFYAELSDILGGEYVPEPILATEWINPQLSEASRQEIESGMLSEKEADIRFGRPIDFQKFIDAVERATHAKCSVISGNTLSIDPKHSRYLQQRGVLNILVIARHF